MAGKSGNIMHQNVSNILEAQKDVLKENTTAEEVKEKIGKPAMFEPPTKSEPQEEKGKMVFKGFKYSDTSCAKVETYLPVLNTKVRQTPILFQEELNLAQTIITDKDVMMDTLTILYQHIVEGPTEITPSFETFLKNVPEPDYDALLYGFFLNSYGPDVKVEDTLKCINCGKEHFVESINLLNLYKETPYEGEAFECLKVIEEVNLNDCGIDASFFLKMPSLEIYSQDKKISKRNFISELTSGNFADYICKLVYAGEEFTDKESIVNAINTLNVTARRKLKKVINDKYNKYGIKFTYEWTCDGKVPDTDSIKEKAEKKCNKANTKNYRIFDLFFREISESIS